MSCEFDFIHDFKSWKFDADTDADADADADAAN